mmetsp:Transcript_9349/g.34628  ORF Transcript_9349/g.34628 Transcript_9349/m.34628 type:complete len:215 (+) Transcript_9349:1203-1847(+)
MKYGCVLHILCLVNLQPKHQIKCRLRKLARILNFLNGFKVSNGIFITRFAKQTLKQHFCPHHAMQQRTRIGSNGAHGKGLLSLLWLAFVAFGASLLDGHDLTEIACGASIQQRHIRSQTHSIHMLSSTNIIQRVHHHLESLEIIHREVGGFDISVMRGDFVQVSFLVRHKAQHRLFGHLALAPPHMLLPKQKLPIQIRHVNCIQVYDFYIPKAR